MRQDQHPGTLGDHLQAVTAGVPAAVRHMPLGHLSIGIRQPRLIGAGDFGGEWGVKCRVMAASFGANLPAPPYKPTRTLRIQNNNIWVSQPMTSPTG